MIADIYCINILHNPCPKVTWKTYCKATVRQFWMEKLLTVHSYQYNSIGTYVSHLLQTFSIVEKKVKVTDLWFVQDIPHMHQLYTFEEVDRMICTADMLLTSLPVTYLTLENRSKIGQGQRPSNLSEIFPKMHLLYHFEADQMNCTAGTSLTSLPVTYLTLKSRIKIG